MGSVYLLHTHGDGHHFGDTPATVTGVGTFGFVTSTV